MIRKVILLSVMVCSSILLCRGQWYFIAHEDCYKYANASIAKAILEVAGENFVEEVLQTQRGGCAWFLISIDSLGKVVDIKYSSYNRKAIFSEEDVSKIKQYLIEHDVRMPFCPAISLLSEVENGINYLCSDEGKENSKDERGYFRTRAVFPGWTSRESLGCDSASRLLRYVDWIENHLYPNCLPMCEPCGCNSMEEISNDYIFQQLSSGGMMTDRLLKEYMKQSEDVKLKFLYELSHPQHKDFYFQSCIDNIKSSWVLPSKERARMIEAIKQGFELW